MEQAGEGALRRQFEALKARLAEEGLFDPAKKRELPRLPRRLGVLTSPTGAAVRDVLNVLARRMPLLEVEILPVPVQGDTAAAQIRSMLEAAGRAARHDVLLLTRGGGSLEDLWAFNDEALARAIAASPIPVVSAIGHEVDFTIADLVADLRAPTPSAAAELLVPDREALLRDLARDTRRARVAIERRLRGLAQRVDLAHAHLQARAPARRLDLLRGRLQSLGARLALAPRARLSRATQRVALAQVRLEANHPRTQLALRQQRLTALQQRLQHGVAASLSTPASRLALLARALHAFSPLATLARGYALVRAPDGSVIHSAAQAPVDSAIRVQLASGTLDAVVTRSTP
jgi:exodeoxyribonuclease VII large subunit